MAYAMQEKFRWVEQLSESDLAYLNSMPFSISIPSHGCIVVHAGLLPGLPLHQQDLADLIEVMSPKHL